jgi:hypothetical protein
MYADIISQTPTHSAIENYFTGGGWPFQRRHPTAWIVVRAIVLVWFIAFGSILYSHGYTWGALLYLAAARELVFGYRLLKTRQAQRH